MKLLSVAILLFAIPQDKSKGIQAFDGGKPGAMGETPAAFKGEATVSNGRLSLVVPKNGNAVELRATGATRAKLRLVGVDKLDHVAVVDHGKGGATLEIGGKAAKGVVTAKLKVKKADITVEVLPGDGAEKLRVECPTRFIVLPDFFADDIVIDARKLP